MISIKVTFQRIMAALKKRKAQRLFSRCEQLDKASARAFFEHDQILLRIDVEEQKIAEGTRVVSWTRTH